MAKPVVPFAILLNIAFPGGTRLKKREAFKAPVVPYRHVAISPTTIVSPNRSLVAVTSNRDNITLDKDGVPLGNLSNEEYRFWMGSIRADVGFAMCRACRAAGNTREARNNHHLQADCKSDILAAMRALKEAHSCGVCGGKTGTAMWGVPLCKGCVRGWKFNNPRNFESAVNIIRHNKERAEDK